MYNQDLVFVDPIPTLNAAFERLVQACVDKKLAFVQSDGGGTGCDCCESFDGDSISFVDRFGGGLAETFCEAYLAGLDSDFDNIHLQFILKDATTGFRSEVAKEEGFEELYTEVKSKSVDADAARTALVGILTHGYEKLHHVSATGQNNAQRLTVSAEDYRSDFPKARPSEVSGFVTVYAWKVSRAEAEEIAKLTFP